MNAVQAGGLLVYPSHIADRQAVHIQLLVPKPHVRSIPIAIPISMFSSTIDWFFGDTSDDLSAIQ
jgi:hypothetical protein